MNQLQEELDFYSLLPSPDQSNDQDADNMLITPFSKYFTSAELNAHLKDNSSNKSFSCIHFNIRSLSKHFDQFNANLSNIERNIDVLAISETKLNNNSVSNISLPNYDFFNDNSDTMAGGVALYVAKHLRSHQRLDLRLNTPQTESCWIEFEESKAKSVIVGCIYKHPNASINEFTDELDAKIKEFRNNKQTVYILGDFNIDLLKYETHLPTENYVNMLFSNSFFPLITKPTRITDHTATLIDHIYTNNLSANISAGIAAMDISDHLPVFCINSNSNHTIHNNNAYYRDYSKFDKEKYLQDLKNTSWDESLSKDVNEFTSNFSEKLQEIINKHAPLKLASHRKTKIMSKPWLTSGILKSIRKKQKLYYKLKKEKK